jgi:hypothetical protein
VSDIRTSIPVTPGSGAGCPIVLGAGVIAVLAVTVGVAQLVHLVVWLAAVTHLSDWAGPAGIVAAGALFGWAWIRLDSTVDGAS